MFCIFCGSSRKVFPEGSWRSSKAPRALPDCSLGWQHPFQHKSLELSRILRSRFKLRNDKWKYRQLKIMKAYLLKISFKSHFQTTTSNDQKAKVAFDLRFGSVLLFYRLSAFRVHWSESWNTHVWLWLNCPQLVWQRLNYKVHGVPENTRGGPRAQGQRHSSTEKAESLARLKK